MKTMVPLGFEMHLTPTEQLVLLIVSGALATAAALPASSVLAAVGAGRARLAGRPGFWNGTWYWLWGTALTWAATLGGFNLGLGWYSIPVGWLPGFAAAALLRPRHPATSGPQGELLWSDERRPVGE